MKIIKTLLISINETADGRWVASLGIPPGYGAAGFSMRRFGDSQLTEGHSSPQEAAAALVAAVWDKHPSVRTNALRVGINQ